MHLKYFCFVLITLLFVACASPSSSSPDKTSDTGIFSARSSHSALNFKDKIWVLGGYDKNDNINNNVWSSDNGRDWIQVTAAASWKPRIKYGVAVFRDKMWLLGGYEGTIDNFNDIWDSTNGRNWNLVTSDAAWSPRGFFDPFVFNDKLWVVGGGTANEYNNSMIINFNNDVWNSKNGKDWQRVAHNLTNNFISYEAVVFENKIWIFNGGVNNHNSYAWYSSDAITWTRSHKINLHNFSSLLFQNKIWVLGGISTIPSFNFNTELISFTSSNDIEKFIPNWHPRSSHASVVFDNKIWIIGGVYFDNNVPNSFVVFNDIWSWDNTQSDWVREK